MECYSGSGLGSSLAPQVLSDFNVFNTIWQSLKNKNKLFFSFLVQMISNMRWRVSKFVIVRQYLAHQCAFESQETLSFPGILLFWVRLGQVRLGQVRLGQVRTTTNSTVKRQCLLRLKRPLPGQLPGIEIRIGFPFGIGISIVRGPGIRIRVEIRTRIRIILGFRIEIRIGILLGIRNEIMIGIMKKKDCIKDRDQG